ncbi:MAG: inhibitor of vertebrate lysozyme family protein [Enterobacterales bacterium]|nr:inhibitor of vertebrate lysozyme family protein [Enterobacterales bacterium]
MIDKKMLRVALLGTVMSLSTASLAASIPVSTSELVQQSGYQQTWQKMVKGQKNLPVWARKGSGTSTPPEWVTWQGKKYQVGNICKPHDCANNFMYVAFSNDKKQACGVSLEIADTHDPLDHPSKYAKYQWLGKPDSQMKAMLTKQIESAPDWN